MAESAERIEELYNKITSKIKSQLYIENSNNNLNTYLKSIGFEELCRKPMSSYDKTRAKIIVIGDSRIDKDNMCKVAKQLGINPKRIEFRLDYEKNKRDDFRFLEYNTNYSDIIIGPNAHKGVGIEGYSSLISKIEDNIEAYPKMTKVIANNELKFTKNTFKNALKETQLFFELNMI